MVPFTAINPAWLDFYPMLVVWIPDQKALDGKSYGYMEGMPKITWNPTQSEFR